MTDRSDTTAQPRETRVWLLDAMPLRLVIQGRHHLPQPGTSGPKHVTETTLDRVARVLFMRYYIHRDDASEEWAVRYWNECAGAPHKGDCPHAESKGPITCDRCVCDGFRADAQAVLGVLS